MDGSEPIKVAGIEVPAEERTPLVDRLLRVIEEQRAEIRALRDEIADEGAAAAADDPPQHAQRAASRSKAQKAATRQTAGFGQTAEDGSS
jgi:ribosome recycling factor